MSNRNITQRGTQTTGLGVTICRYSSDSQHRGTSHHPVNVGCSFFRSTNDDLSKHTNQRRQHKTWPRENNRLALHYYFRSNPTQRGYRKRTIEIWEECARFHTTSQTLADQVRTIMKKGLFSDLEILEIRQKTNSASKQQDTNTITDAPNIDKQEQFNRNEPQTNSNRNTAHLNLIEPTLTQEKDMNLENLKRIMHEKKTTLLLLRNIDWIAVKAETEKNKRIVHTYLNEKHLEIK